MKKTFEKTAQIAIKGRENYSDDDTSKFMTFNLWEKNGKSRIYINDYKRRTLGYIDRADKSYTQYDNDGLTKDQIKSLLEDFANEYEF